MAVEMGTPSVVASAAFDRNLTAGSAANPLKVSRGDRIRTCDLVLPKQTNIKYHNYVFQSYQQI